MKQSLCSLAQVIRSKNAGPYELVLDILFKTREDYQRVKRSEQLTPQLIAGLYNVKPDFIHRIIWFDPANAVKIVMPRILFPATSVTMMFMALSSMRRY
jgi:hypothetical protein